MSKIEYLRTTANFYHPIEKGNNYVTTSLDDDGWRKRTSMCKEYTAPRNREDSKPCASIDTEKEIGPVLNIEMATIIDVPGIEVQVPSLSSPGYSVRILTTSLRTKEENLNNVCSESSKLAVTNHEQGSHDSNNVKTKVEPSSVHRETVASSMRVNPGLLEKQYRQQRRQQQSCVNTSKDKVQLQKRKGSFERTEFGLLFLDDRCGEDISNAHLQVSLLRHRDESGKRKSGKISRYHTSRIENARCTKSHN